MVKYYYFVYKHKNGIGNSVAKYDGEFNLCSAMQWLEQFYPDGCIILNWKEISSWQYDKLYKKYDK